MAAPPLELAVRAAYESGAGHRICTHIRMRACVRASTAMRRAAVARTTSPWAFVVHVVLLVLHASVSSTHTARSFPLPRCLCPSLAGLSVCPRVRPCVRPCGNPRAPVRSTGPGGGAGNTVPGSDDLSAPLRQAPEETVPTVLASPLVAVPADDKLADVPTAADAGPTHPPDEFFYTIAQPKKVLRRHTKRSTTAVSR